VKQPGVTKRRRCPPENGRGHPAITKRAHQRKVWKIVRKLSERTNPTLTAEKRLPASGGAPGRRP